MAYSNAIFYLDFTLGSDTARTALTGVTAANPSGTITRLTKTAHGLVTGAVVTTSAFTAWLNGDWKITKVDADNFDLDGAVWQATADANGTVTPFGGQSWSDAWQTVTSGATTARIAPGDTIRIAKSPDPVSLGINATWTDKSATVTLASTLTANVYTSGAWTAAANSASITTSTNRKLGANCVQVTLPASPATGTKYAYLTMSSTNFSAYQKISLWFRPSTGGIAAGNWKICLCSDTTGDVIVDSFSLPAGAAVAHFFAITLNKGSALGSAIQSVALYSDTVAPSASAVCQISQIVACGALTFNSLLGKNTGSEPFLAIQSINGTTVILDANPDTNTGGNTYSGTTETVTAYIREPIQIAMPGSSNSSNFSVQDSGVAGSQISFLGGWDTGSTTQNGETYITGRNNLGYGINLGNIKYITIEKISLSSFGTAIAASSLPSAGTELGFNLSFGDLTNCSTGLGSLGNYVDIGSITIRNLVAMTTPSATLFNLAKGTLAITNLCSNAQIFTTTSNSIITITNANNNGSGAIVLSLDSICTITTCKDNGNNGGVTLKGGTLKDTNCSGGNTASVGASTVKYSYCENVLMSDTTEAAGSSVGSLTPFLNYRLISKNHDQIAGYSKIFTDGGLIESETTVRHTASGKSWKLSPTATYRTSAYPLDLEIGRVAVAASALVTVKAWLRRSNTGLTMALVCRGGQIGGVAANVTASMTAAADTWEEVTITFTPNEAGVVAIEAWAYGGTTYAGYVDDLTISQA